ncbi:GvpL/GvpF family gas vesicle protein [Streptomyces sp. NPDC005438]|uniref:GvpL/GvpF family gas vesicle protein n=1 Tax=Streptomyces sp. NPDC005438 TaxID=3156880 RepID=UPI0033B4C827
MTSPERPEEHPDEELSYVYAIATPTPELRRAAETLAGLEDRAVRTVHARGLAAVVSSVPSSAYGESALAARLEDLARLEVIARGHHGVVDALATHGTVLPLRLATLYQDDARVAEMLDASSERLHQRLERLSGHLEWGVKVYLTDPAPATAPPSDTARTDAARTTGGDNPGRAYLRRRQEQRSHLRQAQHAATLAVDRVAEAAGAHASHHAAHRLQQGELATHEGRNIANDAYLVLGERAEAFLAAVEEAGRGLTGVRVEVTGPWAPYSFTGPLTDTAPPPSVAREHGDGR